MFEVSLAVVAMATAAAPTSESKEHHVMGEASVQVRD